MKQQPTYLNCPQCHRSTPHHHHVSANMDVYTCQVCGNVQSYLRSLEEDETFNTANRSDPHRL